MSYNKRKRVGEWLGMGMVIGMLIAFNSGEVVGDCIPGQRGNPGHGYPGIPLMLWVTGNVPAYLAPPGHPQTGSYYTVRFGDPKRSPGAFF